MPHRCSRWTAAVCLGALGVLLWVPLAPAMPLEGYPTDMSLAHGETLELHVRSERQRYSVSIWRQGQNLERVAFAGVFSGQTFSIPPEAWLGCNWPVTCSVRIREDWRPGAYLARVDAVGAYTYIPFVVRSREPGRHASILVQLSTNTWQAYNRYGGKSLYGAHAPGLQGRAYRVSFHRPYNHYSYDGSGQFFMWEAGFLSFLESYGYAYEVCTNGDLHRDPSLPSRYRLFCSVGHDEYYTKEMFDALENYVDSGGNIAFFSGNSIWWQARLEDDGHTLVCYKSAGLDPLLDVDNSRVTVNWHAAPVFRPPARLMGIYYNGSYGVPVGGYKVFDPDSWVFRGLDVRAGQEFGFPMVGFEVDARTSDSPRRLDLIASTELEDSNNGGVLRLCEMIYYERSPAYGFPGGRGGAVFSSGSVNYAMGLTDNYNSWQHLQGRPDPIARAVTVNVLDRLGGTLGAPVRVAPADSGVVTAGQALLTWRHAPMQRPGAAVHYTVHWQVAADSVQSVVTDGLAAWVPVRIDTRPCEWWVEAHSAWNQAATSTHGAFYVSAQVATARPSLDVQREGAVCRIRVSTSNGGEGSVEIFDVAGRRVRRFDRRFQTGLNSIDWDLQSTAGVRAASGTYIVRARVGSWSDHRAIVLLPR